MFEYGYEVGKAADVLVRRLLGVREGETLVITADTGSDARAADACASAAYACGAKPVVVHHICPATMGKSGDPVLPVEALSGVLMAADAWIELDSSGLMFTTPYDRATAHNKKLRAICMGSSDVDLLVRCVGRVDFAAMARFEKVLLDKLSACRNMRITSPGGTDVSFEQDPAHPVHGALEILEGKPAPGSFTLPGAVAWAPKLDSISGTIVFDGAIGVPAINMSLLASPVVLEVERGVITSFGGGAEARRLEAYLRSFDHPQTMRLAHTGLGFNPGAITRCRFGNMLEDERIWGATHWGIGEISAGLAGGKQVPAPMHCDGSSLGSSIEADGQWIVREGEFVDPALVPLAADLKRVLV